MKTPCLEIHGITKRFGGLTATDDRIQGSKLPWYWRLWMVNTDGVIGPFQRRR